ncbi:MAG: transketolase [Alphaproteobacteria bacterium]|nr:transketolase [Alphaproteobacteria bacterium]
MQQKEIEKLNNMANAVRFLSIDMITKAKSGHPGLPMGCAELATTLFAKHLKFSVNYPKWENRDRFILSAGHGSALLYSLLYLSGYKDISIEDIKNFRQLNSKTAGHPEYGFLDGIETTTGPLGQGIATSVGIAIAEKFKQAKLGSDIINNKVYVLAGDGCLMEGISEEAISLAGTLNLNNLIILWDDNNITIDGNATIANRVDMKERFKANNWNIFEVKNGYDVNEIDEVITLAKSSDKPAFIDIHTIIGHGYKPVENTASVHGSPLSEEQIVEAKQSANYPTTSFEIPSEILSDWNSIGHKFDSDAKLWNEKVENLDSDKKDFLNLITKKLFANIDNIFVSLKDKFVKENFAKATRNANGVIVEEITPYIKNLIGGTADLAGPTVVKNKNTKEITAENFDGNFIHYGIREHEMAACMNGLSLSGIKAFGSTFFTFFDYLKPALRLSALMHQGTVYVFTHDSFFIGEDGPTHQPIEHLASLRATPNVNVIRPADAIESTEAWQIAINENTKPTVLLFSRQATPLLRTDATNENKVSKGAYIISDFAPNKEKLMTIIATGTEVATAIEVQKLLLEKHNINACVVSMPSMNLFDMQSEEYKESVIDDETITVSIEAGSTFGWAKYAEINIGLDSFGASAPAKDLQTKFGFTPEQITEEILNEIK